MQAHAVFRYVPIKQYLICKLASLKQNPYFLVVLFTDITDQYVVKVISEDRI